MNGATKHKGPGALLIIAAFAPRLIVFLLAYFHPQASLPPDSSAYMTLAENLWKHQVFARILQPLLVPETFRVPGYPLFLSPYTGLFPAPVLWIAAAQCLLGAITVLIMWTWLRSMTDERSALAGALVMALDYVTVLYTPMVLAETLVTFLEVSALVLTWRGLSVKNARSALASGLLWGIAMIVKPVFVFLPLGLCWVWAPRKKIMLTFLIASYLVPTGWIFRNGVETRFWGLSSLSGYTLLAYPATSVESMATGRPCDVIQSELQAQADTKFPSGYRDDAEQSQAYHDVAVPIIKAHPVLLARYCLIGSIKILFGTGVSLLLYYTPLQFQKNLNWSTHIIGQNTFGVLRQYPWLIPIQGAYGVGLLALYFFSVLGWIRLWKRGLKREMIFLAGGAFYFLLMACPQGDSRFRIPMLPFLAGALTFSQLKFKSKNEIKI